MKFLPWLYRNFFAKQYYRSQGTPSLQKIIGLGSKTRPEGQQSVIKSHFFSLHFAIFLIFSLDTPSNGVTGLLGAGVAFLWANFHWRLMDGFGKLGLLDDENIYAVPRVLVGAAGVVTIGMLVPQTMFWGEWEFPVLATLSPASDLPHVWPTTGLIGFEMNSCLNCLIVGFCKLLAISFTVAGGYRGGYIFPFFTAGAAFGRALCFAFPKLSPVIATLCFAAGINVAITRTALATSLILAFLVSTIVWSFLCSFLFILVFINLQVSSLTGW